MQNKIIVLGAGRSATVLLWYLDQLCRQEQTRYTLADADPEVLRIKSAMLPTADTVVFQSTEVSDIKELIGNHAIVISLLPPPMHPSVARACLLTRSHLITASYESPEMRSLAPEVESAGLVFINECGLDPGIDHMSAMEIIHDIQQKGGQVTKFYSYCGGLVADECDDNPFKYKISWNPRNVVLAGKGTSRYLENGRTSLLPYHRLFGQQERVEVPGWGTFEGYANRDSEPYAALYGLHNIETLKRGTLRKPGFCERWNVFVQLGLTDDTSHLRFEDGATYADLMEVFLPGFSGHPATMLQAITRSGAITTDILEMGFLPHANRKLKRNEGTPADFLLDLIVENWVLQPTDTDLVVMTHIFEYKLEGSDYQIVSSFGLKGQDASLTAMATTVGLPLGIVAKMLLHNQINQKGLLLPLQSNIYKPVLKELSNFGIHFQTVTKPLK